MECTVRVDGVDLDVLEWDMTVAVVIYGGAAVSLEGTGVGFRGGVSGRGVSTVGNLTR